MAGCIPVAIDVEALLRRVVAEVSDADVDAAYSTEPKAPHVHRVRLTDPSGTRQAGLRASYEWFDVTIFDLGVSTTLYDYDYDDEEKDKERPSCARWRWSSVPTSAARGASSTIAV